MKVKNYYVLLENTVQTFKGNYVRENGIRLWKYTPKKEQ
jgi:hypothetical protein